MSAATLSAPADVRVARRARLGKTTRHAVLSVHIAVSVGLLGDSAGFLAVALHHSTTSDPAVKQATRDVLVMFASWFGIPLSFLALTTGVVLGVGTRWGVFRSPWVLAKLALTASVILVGALVFRPLLFGNTPIDSTRLLLAAGWDVAALSAATGLSVFKPGRTRNPRSTRQTPDTAGRDSR